MVYQRVDTKYIRPVFIWKLYNRWNKWKHFEIRIKHSGHFIMVVSKLPKRNLDGHCLFINRKHKNVGHDIGVLVSFSHQWHGDGFVLIDSLYPIDASASNGQRTMDTNPIGESSLD